MLNLCCYFIFIFILLIFQLFWILENMFCVCVWTMTLVLPWYTAAVYFKSKKILLKCRLSAKIQRGLEEYCINGQEIISIFIQSLIGSEATGKIFSLSFFIYLHENYITLTDYVKSRMHRHHQMLHFLHQDALLRVLLLFCASLCLQLCLCFML